MKQAVPSRDTSRRNRPSLTALASAKRAIAFAPPHRRHRILCVDDDIVGSRARGELLQELGYSVVLYNSPATALGCDFSAFDLAVLDFAMPGLNGRELLLRMRAAGARFPVILLSGYADSLCREDRHLFAGCIDKLSPIQCLLERIATLLTPH